VIEDRTFVQSPVLAVVEHHIRPVRRSRTCGLWPTGKAVGPYPSEMRSFFVVLAAMVLAAACSACGSAGGASNSIIDQARVVAMNTSAPGPDVPETLSAATAAAQANVDRFSSGDFAGVWELMSQEVRNGITREDFVTFYETCKKTGPRFRVTGVSLDAAAGEAVVRVEAGGVGVPRIMRFENGAWVMQPTQGFAAHLGEPVAQIIAEEKAAGLCSS
jgi:hypothetical protein